MWILANCFFRHEADLAPIGSALGAYSDSVMDISSEHRRFLIVDQGVVPTVYNFFLNGFIAWLLFRSAESVPLWGRSSIVVDTLATAFILPLATCIIVSYIVARQVSTGRISPIPEPATTPVVAWLAAHTPVQRGAALGLAGIVVAAIPVFLWFAIGGPKELALSSFLLFKASFAAALAVIVSPVIG